MPEEVLEIGDGGDTFVVVYAHGNGDGGAGFLINWRGFEKREGGKEVGVLKGKGKRAGG